jgi:hypothetical protein
MITFYGGKNPPSKIGEGNPHKYGSWWRGPYQATQVLQHCDADLVDKPRYSMHNFVTDKKYVVETHQSLLFRSNLRHTAKHRSQGYRRDIGE